MLTPEQIAALRDAFGQLADPVNDYLIKNIARRISEAGQLTSTAAYEVWRAQQLGKPRKQIEAELKKILQVTHQDLERLLTQTAEVGYRFDLSRLPVQAVPFEKNPVIQQIVSAAVELAQDDFTNLTQTIGMVDPFGNALPLQDVYRSCTDFAFKQVATGATDYMTAIRQATANIAKHGVRVIEYESGVHTGLEAAIRRNIMSGLGLMQEQITQHNQDTLGANGWEISAHAASAPDHEPIQGKQYSDHDYETLNNSLQRRIGTLNCGHAAFPIILGISKPMYTPEQLRKFREDNAAGIDYQGRHYSMYEATQQQRKIERAIRAQKRRIQVAEGTGDEERLTAAQIRLTRLNEEYRRFSKATGLRTQRERAEIVGFDRKQAVAARNEAEAYYKYWSKSIGANKSSKTLAQYYDMKYNNSPEYELLKQYAQSVESGMISPISGFDNYKALYQRVQSELVGQQTSNGVPITAQSAHFMERVIGTGKDPKSGKSRSGVSIDDIKQALLHGKYKAPKTTTNGRSQLFYSDTCAVSVNPDTGRLIQCNLK